jgi:para-aminobenzoate synthetase
MQVRRLDALPDGERAFANLYGASPHAFWLDGGAADAAGRFSFLGDSSGPLGALVTYDVATREVRVERGGRVELRRESIFDYLAGGLERLRPLSAELPFEFDCGFAATSATS